jgi:isoquinoline 1-oxidoreductase beta subunit
MKRRQFLKHTGVFTVIAATGGLQIVNANPGNPALLSSPDLVLSIDEAGKVIFVSPYTEMGQGSPTAASMIIADELDTDLERLELRHHDGRVVQTNPDYADRFNGGGSGGSQSMASGWTALREIGATARTTLIAAAAIQWSVDAGECDTNMDCVLHKPSGRTIGYADLVAAAAQMKVPEDLRYRSPGQYRYIGNKHKRADTRQILSGRAPYAMDYMAPDMLYASIERCPTIAGVPAEFDRERVLAVSGVIDVFKLDPRKAEKRAKCSVVVVAKDTWSAMQGRKQLRVQWKDDAATFPDEPAFWSAMQKQLDDGKANEELTIGKFDEIDLGKLEQSAEYYRLGHQNQTPMEPIAMTAHHQGDRFELWTSTQYPMDFRDRIAEITGLNQDHITLHNTIMGGSFGRRYVRDAVTEVIMIADHLRQPVKLVWTREDDIRNGQYRNASLSKVEAHFDDAGKLHRWYQKAVQTSPDDPSEVKSLSSGMSDQAYQFETARYEMHGLKGNVNLGPMRSPPHPAKLFPTVCFIDELAHRFGEDPIDLHIRLIGSYRELPQGEWLAGLGHVDNTGTHVQVANTVRAMSEWDKPLPEGHGKGFAVGYMFGTHLAMVVETAWQDEMISIEKVWCAVNCGRVINPDIARQQVEGGTIYGLSGAMGEVITTAGGAVQQSNFHDYPIMRFAQAPEIDVKFIKSDERPSGLGEPATPPAYPALANSIFASSGQRIREIPLKRHIKFAPSRRFT